MRESRRRLPPLLEGDRKWTLTPIPSPSRQGEGGKGATNDAFAFGFRRWAASSGRCRHLRPGGRGHVAFQSSAEGDSPEALQVRAHQGVARTCAAIGGPL